jgi:D-glycero-beta-D-manno-heptose 1-phosphate adenylyltransferase
MKSTQQILHKIYTQDHLLKQVNAWRVLNKKIVFTTAIFDILEKMDIALLNEAASFGDILIVGINADPSAKKMNKSAPHMNNENARALLLASLLQTDAVVIFEEDITLQLVKNIMPDVLVVSGNYTLEQIASAKKILAGSGEMKMVNVIDDI